MGRTCTLLKKTCAPCRGNFPLSFSEELEMLAKQLNPGWKIIFDHHLSKEYHFSDYRSALNFTMQVGELAELEGHHPHIHLSYEKVKLLIWTHEIDGLSENDFILAAKCDALIE